MEFVLLKKSEVKHSILQSLCLNLHHQSQNKVEIPGKVLFSTHFHEHSLSQFAKEMKVRNENCGLREKVPVKFNFFIFEH